MKQLKLGGNVSVEAPASKSVLNRALLLSALHAGDTQIACGPLCADTRTLAECLQTLGVGIERVPGGLLVHGTNAPLTPRSDIDVGSAGTAARFLTAALAFRGGDYAFRASAQMARRPMDVLKTLEAAGVRFEFPEAPYRFPFSMHSEGIGNGDFTTDTSISSQFASGLMLGAALAAGGRITLTGDPRDSFPAMTLRMIASFGGSYTKDGNRVEIFPIRKPTPHYPVEGDVSGACYFYALALLLKKRVAVRGIGADVFSDPLQGDVRFLSELLSRGVKREEQCGELVLDGSDAGEYPGFTLDVAEFADQAITFAALAPFAASETRLRGISHLRGQECDRVQAIVQNLHTLGVPAYADPDEIVITPAQVKGGRVRTFGDHRVAMGFSLIGMRTGNVTIDDPACTEKTFEHFFDLVSSLD